MGTTSVFHMVLELVLQLSLRVFHNYITKLHPQKLKNAKAYKKKPSSLCHHNIQNVTPQILLLYEILSAKVIIDFWIVSFLEIHLGPNPEDFSHKEKKERNFIKLWSQHGLRHSARTQTKEKVIICIQWLLQFHLARNILFFFSIRRLGHSLKWCCLGKPERRLTKN